MLSFKSLLCHIAETCSLIYTQQFWQTRTTYKSSLEHNLQLKDWQMNKAQFGKTPLILLFWPLGTNGFKVVKQKKTIQHPQLHLRAKMHPTRLRILCDFLLFLVHTLQKRLWAALVQVRKWLQKQTGNGNWPTLNSPLPSLPSHRL